MAEEIKNPTSAQEYRERFSLKTKLVTLPSGAVFKIRKLGVLDFLTSVVLPIGLIGEKDIKEMENKSIEEREEIVKQNTTPEKSLALSKQLLLASTISPKLVDNDNPKEDEVSLEELDDFDKLKLSQAVVELNSLDKASRVSIEPFRSE